MYEKKYFCWWGTYIWTEQMGFYQVDSKIILTRETLITKEVEVHKILQWIPGAVISQR